MHFGRQIARNEFTTSEVEFSMLAKIGAQGHEAHVLAGMWALIDRFKPVLIVETGAVVLMDELKTHGYRADRAPGSSNVVFRPL